MGNLTILCFLSLIVASINSLPVGTRNENLPTIVVPEIVDNPIIGSINTSDNGGDINNDTDVKVGSRSGLARTRIREGMTVLSYVVNLETDVNSETFSGHVIIRVEITPATREDPVRFLVEDLDITNVQFSLTANGVLREPENTDMGDEDGEGFLEIETGSTALSYHFVIDFEGSLSSLEGFYIGHYDDETYVAMNLHPTHARRVFPCIDDPMEVVTLTMTIDGLPYNNLFGNTELGDDDGEFNPTNVRPHLWGMIAHDLPLINNPVPNSVSLYARRQGTNNMENQAVVAINSFFTFLNEWTGYEYEEIAANEQPGLMRMIALPDVNLNWNSISIVGVWEPYIFMEQQQPSAKQRMEAWENIATAMARQWFGFAIFPSNWMHEWLMSGLGTYAAYEALKNFQNLADQPDDESLLDFDTLFIANIYQESLLRDGHLNAIQLRPEDEIFLEEDVREYTAGLVRFKAPSVLFMLRNIIGDEPLHQTVQDMLDNWALTPVNDVNFITTLEEHIDGALEELEEWFEPYLDNNGYAVINVVPSANGAIISQRRFCFTSGSPQNTYEIPISFTTSNNPDFEDYSPQLMLANQAETLNFVLDEEEDWVIFNIQGRGYYRVNYHLDLWERIIMALEDPDVRSTIHPLNRAAILDDALNLARANELDWDIAFRIVLTMEHETEYAPWKAFIRNMNFLKKRLLAMVFDDEDLDQDIYLRMVRRTIGSIENEFGFDPEVNVIEPVMTSLTRGMVMEHACKAGYDPCIAAAVDWFYSDSDEPTVNPEIPQDLRPAVYCTMAMNGDEEVITALRNRLETAPSMYERVVILESLACSQDEDFINEYLRETIEGEYSIEERSKIFIAIAESSFQNANQALGFLIRETNAIRDNYGGPARLEALIYAMVDNIADADMTDQFIQWVNSMIELSGLDDSIEVARRARDMIQENMIFNNDRLEEAYEWIDDNDATKAAMSIVLVLLTFALTMFNH